MVNLFRSFKRSEKALWILLALGTFIFFIIRAWQMPRSDVWAYVQAGKDIFQGDLLYKNRETPFKYSPVIAFLFIPISFLSYKTAQILVVVFSWFLAIPVYLKIRRLFGGWVTLGVFAWCIRFHVYDFINAQINHLILFLIFYSFWIFHLRKQEIIAGPMLAMGILFKVLPAVALPGLFLASKKKYFLSATISLVLMLITPAVVWGLSGYGFQNGLELYGKWLGLLKKTTPYPASMDVIFQSVQAGLWRFWDHSSPALFQQCILGIFAILVSLSLARASVKKLPLGPAFAALLVLSVIFSPLAWKHGYILLFPAIVYILAAKRYFTYGMLLFLAVIFPVSLNHIWAKSGDATYTLVFSALVAWAFLVFDIRGVSAVKWQCDVGDGFNKPTYS